ncbi:MAG: adenosylmethionine decarboxylase [Pseudomonadota bacterium]|nr:adenosylmethionine decarboxylase [Pseudomonadota bacterium]
MKGLHIIADLYNCQKSDLLLSSANLRELCVNACTGAGLTVLGDHFIQFDGADGTQQGGSTGAVVLAESHLAIHTWPERDGATLDVYVCNFTCDNTGKAEAVYKTLVKALKPGDVIVERIQRGRDLPLKKRVA